MLGLRTTDSTSDVCLHRNSDPSTARLFLRQIILEEQNSAEYPRCFVMLGFPVRYRDAKETASLRESSLPRASRLSRVFPSPNRELGSFCRYRSGRTSSF